MVALLTASVASAAVWTTLKTTYLSTYSFVWLPQGLAAALGSAISVAAWAILFFSRSTWDHELHPEPSALGAQSLSRLTAMEVPVSHTFEVVTVFLKSETSHCVCGLVAQWCLTLCDPMDCSLPDSSGRAIFQARILEWVAIPFSRGSSQPRDWIHICYISGRFFTLYCLSHQGSHH